MQLIFTLLILAALVVACGYLDRYRGSDRLNLRVGANSVDTLIYGLVAAILLDITFLPALAFAVLFWIGEKPGWGEPLGSVLHKRPMRPDQLEWWQVGPLAKSAEMACLLRGIIWGLPTLLLLPWAPQVSMVPVAMGIAFIAAPLLSRAWFTSEPQWVYPLPPTDKGLWDKAEAVRGWIFGALLLAFQFLPM